MELVNIMGIHSGRITAMNTCRYSIDTVASEEDVILSIDDNGYFSS